MNAVAEQWQVGPVRVRVRAKDPFEGLKGAAYIEARGLTPRPNHNMGTCPHCALHEMLPAVQNIVARWKVN